MKHIKLLIKNLLLFAVLFSFITDSFSQIRQPYEQRLENVGNAAARDALDPEVGDIVKLTDSGNFQIWDGAAWEELGGLQHIKINSSAAAITETLPVSASNNSILFYVNDDVTNVATLAVQAGETLNGVTDATFLFSNYPKGTQFRVDEVAGGWVVSVVAAPTKKQRHYVYLNTRTSSTITDTPDGKIPFNDPNWTTDDPFTMIDATNVTRINILQDGRYHVRFEANVNGAGDDVDRLQMLKNGTEILHDGILYERSSNADRAYIYVDYKGTLLANDYIEIRDPDGAAIASDISNATMTVEQVETEETVLAGMTTPYKLTYGFAQHISTSNTNIFATIANGQYTPTQNTTVVQPATARVDILSANDVRTNGIAANAEGFIINKDGNYSIDIDLSFDYSNSASAVKSFQIVKNGTEVLTSGTHYDQSAPSNSTMPASSNWIGDLAAGDTIDIRLFQHTAGDVLLVDFAFRVEQNPSSTVVMPDAVPVEDISTVGLFDNEVAAVFDGYEFRAVSSAQEFQMRVTTGTKAITGFTSYDAGTGQNTQNRSITLDQNWTTVWADATLNMPDVGDFQRLYWNDGTNDYEFRGIVGAGYNNNFIEIKRLNQQSVIDANDTPVNTTEIGTPISPTSTKVYAPRFQGDSIVKVLVKEYESNANGFWSVDHESGEMVQRGITPNATDIAVTLPIAFGNNTYTVTGNAEGVNRWISIYNHTTTQFTYTARNEAGGAFAAVVRWQAIGRKP